MAYMVPGGAHGGGTMHVYGGTMYAARVRRGHRRTRRHRRAMAAAAARDCSHGVPGAYMVPAHCRGARTAAPSESDAAARLVGGGPPSDSEPVTR